MEKHPTMTPLQKVILFYFAHLYSSLLSRPPHLTLALAVRETLKPARVLLWPLMASDLLKRPESDLGAAASANE
jgi:hypothetical protein